MPRWFRYCVGSLICIAAVLLFLVAAGGANSVLFDQWFPILLVCNIFAAVTLFIFVSAVIWRLVKRYREKLFGSRMTGNLALVISLITVFPCLLIYLVSSQFIGRSIDSWFDVRVEHALDSGVALSGEIIEREQQLVKLTALRMAKSLSSVPYADLTSELTRLKETADITTAELFDGNAKRLFTTADDAPQSGLVPSKDELAKAREQRGITSLEGDSAEGDEPLRIRALVPAGTVRTPQGTTRLYLQLTQQVPPGLASNVSDLVNGFRDYQELVLTRGALRDIYGVTLTLAMLMAILGAVTAALRFAGNMAAPVLQLAKGTRKVAEGDLRPIREYPGNDEINELTQSFNSMIFQIAEARTLVENQRLQAEQARASLERILSNISSGVLVVDSKLHISTANVAASTILKNKRIGVGAVLPDIEPELAEAIRNQIRLADKDSIHTELELHKGETAEPLVIFLRGARIDLDNGEGWVIVFDDMSAMIDAQKALAWGEVARRLAHEIKNPLTPIRLAAERLNIKLTGKLDAKDETLLHRACSTIVSQVDAMKQMVNDFRDYARLPAAVLAPLDINAFLKELEALYSAAGTPIELNLTESLPAVNADSNQLRQVIHNLVGNALDATVETKEPEIRISTGIVETTGSVRVVLEDNGPGFSPDILSRAFEPYITTKATGTGLGLPMVKKIIEEHHAKVTVMNRTDKDGHVCGASITMIFPGLQSAASRTSDAAY